MMERIQTGSISLGMGSQQCEMCLAGFSLVSGKISAEGILRSRVAWELLFHMW